MVEIADHKKQRKIISSLFGRISDTDGCGFCVSDWVSLVDFEKGGVVAYLYKAF